MSLVSLLLGRGPRESIRDCLKRLDACRETGLPTEVLVVDDGATEKHPLKGLNKLAQQAKGEFLCLISPHAEFTPGWLTNLVQAAQRDSTIGLVGNKHLCPDTGRIVHAGLAFDRYGNAVRIHAGAGEDDPRACVSRECRAVDGACWLVPRELFLACGGFDEAFQHEFADLDFCLRVRQRNRKVYYCAESVIRHPLPQHERAHSADRQHFLSKWQGALYGDLHQREWSDLPSQGLPSMSRTEPPQAAADRDAADVHFSTRLDSAEPLALMTARLALAVEEAGCRVSLDPASLHPTVAALGAGQLKKMMRRPASRRVQIKWSRDCDESLLEEIAADVTAEIFAIDYRHQPLIKTKLGRWLRHVAMNDHRKLPLSNYCRDALIDLGVPSERCSLLPLGFTPEMAQRPEGKPTSSPFRFLTFIDASDPHRGGLDLVMEACCQSCQPTEDVVLQIVESGAPDSDRIGDCLARFRGGPKVERIKQPPAPAELATIYHSAHAFISAARGQAFGIEVLDALAAGLPVILPAQGGPLDYLTADGYFAVAFDQAAVESPASAARDHLLPPEARWIEVDVDSLAAQMHAVRDNPPEARRRAEIGRQHVLANFSWQQAARHLQTGLKSFLEQRDRVVAVRAIRAGVTQTRLSAVVATYNRPDALTRSLQAYAKQTLPRDAWEVLVIDDGSNYPVSEIVDQFRDSVRVRLLGDGKNRGQGGARNMGISETRGDLILFANDDIIAHPDMIAEHVRAHGQHPQPQVSVLGFVDWPLELDLTPMMRFITEEGGHQFYYDALRPGEFAPYDFFYTCNVSVKRSFLIERELLFSRCFTMYGYEDIELGARLHQHGMKLLYHPHARGSHWHPMTDEQIFKRQYRVGRMLTVYAMVQPARVPEEHVAFLRWVEMYQHWLSKEVKSATFADDLHRSANGLQIWLEGTLATLDQLLGQVSPELLAGHASRGMLDREMTRWRPLRDRVRCRLLEMMMRSGMADEWVGAKEDEPNPARDFLRFQLASGMWDLFQVPIHQPPAPPAVPAPPMPIGRVHQWTREAKDHPLVKPLWQRLAKKPYFQRAKRLSGSILKRLP